MAAKGRTYPRLNLTRHHAEGVVLTFTSEPTERIAAIIGDLGVTREVPFLSVATYTPRGSNRHIVEELASLREDPAQVLFVVSYRTPVDPSEELPARLKQPGRLLAALATLPDPVRLQCQVGFGFLGRDERSVYPLPQKVHDRDLPFDEIRGIRGVKLADDGSDRADYSFVLDQPGERITLQVTFSLTAKITEATPGEVLTFAATIARQLVVPARDNEG